MPPIKLRPTPWSAYNEHRPANALLLAHVRELERAVRKAGRRVMGGHPRTEGEVAAYIRQLNRALHNQLLLPALKRRPLHPSDAVGTTAASVKASRRRVAPKPAKRIPTLKTGSRARSTSRRRTR